MQAKGAGDVEPLRVAIEAASADGVPSEDLRRATQILRELEEAQQPLTFADVPRPQMEELQRVTSREAAVAILSCCLGLAGDKGFQALILQELHYHNFAFTQRSGFSAEKASTVISIFKTVHTKAIAQEKLPAAAAHKIFVALIDRHSQQLPPYRVGVFSREEAAAIKSYAERSFFKHYKMYAFAYVTRQELIVRSAFERVAPSQPVPPSTCFKSCHEVDPKMVPELEDLFLDPNANALGEDAFAPPLVPLLPPNSRPDRSADPFADEHEAKINAAIDEAMQEHLGGLDTRLELPP